jgi:hypothetical protein
MSQDLKLCIVLTGVQLVGAFCALICAGVLCWKFSNCESTNIVICGVVIAVTLAMFFSHSEISYGMVRALRDVLLRKPVATATTAPTSHMFPAMVWIYSILDILALGWLILHSGGANQSVFTPLLLVVVPVITILGAGALPVTVLLLLTIVVLTYTLFTRKEPRFDPAEDNGHPRRLYLSLYWGTTVICTTFPIVVYVLSR